MPARLRRANRTRALSPPGRVHDWAITPTLQPFGLHIIIPNQPATATEYPRQWHFSGGHDARRVLRQGLALLAASGDRKSVRANHPPDGPPSLFAHLSGGTLRVPFTAGWRCPPAPPTTFCKRWTKTLSFASHRDRVHAPISVSAEVRRATRFTCRLSLPFCKRLAKTLSFY